MKTAASIHGALRDLALADPRRPALVQGSRIVERGELDAWSDAIAMALAENGVTAGSIVPLRLDTSPALVAAALGALKLGAAYAVMEPHWSRQRLRRIDQILRGAFAVVAPGASGGDFRHEIELPGPDCESRDDQWEPVRTDGADLSTVFFTSGSTGEPKAVPATHEAVLRLFAEKGFVPFDDTTVMPQIAAPAWDAFALELWGPLLHGGVCLLRDRRPITPWELRRDIVEHGVNSLFLTSSLFNVVVDEDVSAFGGLRFVIVGGEELSAAHAARFLETHPGLPLVNGYGPAEATVFALTHRVTRDDCDGPIPLGRPIPKTEVHVLDGDSECAAGEVGELCISGAGVSPGYLGEAELTTAAFTEVSIGDRRLRVYRTGDYGSKTSDGLYLFAGRRDRQLKIRGQRMDAGQIERVAAGFDGVRQCAVVPIPGLSGRPESLGLAVVSTDDGFDEIGLRSALESSLPSGWAPNRVVRLKTLPLTDNGKLDAAALVAAVAAQSPDERQAEPPDPLHDLFQRALGGATVDPHASLFALGGTSLTAVRLASALSRQTGLSIPVSVVFNHPSLEAVRAWVADQTATTPSAETAVDRVPLTGMQESFLLHHLGSGDDAYNHVRQAWRIAGRFDVERLTRALEHVHGRHGYLQGCYTLDDVPMWNRTDRRVTIDQFSAPDIDTARRRVHQALVTPLSLADGIVWRAALCAIDDGAEWIFGIAVHHVAFDGWSLRIFTEDLASAYASYGIGTRAQPITATPSPSAVYDEVRRLRDSANLTAQRAYWKQKLTGLDTGPAPWLSPAPLPDFGVKTIEAVLTSEQRDFIRRRTVGAGLLPLFLAAMGSALADVTGAEDVVVGVPVSQRSTPILEEPIACLINMVCVRLRPGAADRMAATVQSALRNSDLTIAEVAELVKQRPWQPLYQVIGVVQDSPDAELRLEGCDVRPVSQPYSELAAPLVVELLAEHGAVSLLRVSYETSSVADETAHDLAAGLMERLTAAEARHPRP